VLAPQFLPGDCGVGQLTAKGYSQQLANGAAAAAAYVGAGLLPQTLSDDSASLFYLRSDNECVAS
jgi:hypothetical protein